MASEGMSTVDRSYAQKRTLFFLLLPSAAPLAAVAVAVDVTPRDAPAAAAPTAAAAGVAVFPVSVAALSSCLIAQASVATIAISSERRCHFASGRTATRVEDNPAFFQASRL